MARWRIVRSWSFEGPAEPGADCDGGEAFAIEPEGGGEERTLAVQYASRGPRPSTSTMRAVAEKWLDDEAPPRYVTLDRQGRIVRTS